MKNLIGRKVRGFKFVDTLGLNYDPEMDVHIGEVGTIEGFDEVVEYYLVRFANDYWFYPADQIEAHLVDEWVVGEEYEFSDDERNWSRGKLLDVLPEGYVNRFIVTSISDKSDWFAYNHIRPIESNPIQYKIERLERELAELKQLINK